MKILMLTPYLPYPLFSGGQIRSYNILRELSKKHEITLFSLIRKHDEKQYIPQLKKYCSKVVVFERKRPFRLDNILLAGFTDKPFILHVYSHTALRQALQEELRKEKYDLLHVETFYVMHNIPATNVPIILFEQNIEHDVYRRITQYFQPFILRPFLLLDVFKIKRWEKYFWKKAQALVFMSETERSVGGDAFTCGNGVDISFYTPLKRERDFRTLYLGNFKWFENIDAAHFLLTEIWPQIKAKLPQAKLFILGKHMPKDLKKKQMIDVIFEESAPDDTREIYANADVLLAPIRAGGGTSFKVLESMATGLPVVTTLLVAKALGAKNREEILVGETASELANGVLEVLQDEKLYNTLSKKARKLVEKKYDWKILVKQIEDIYKSVLT